MHFGNLPKFFAKIWLLSLGDQKRSKNYSSLQKSLKTFRCSRRLQFWEIWQKNHSKKVHIFAQLPKTLSKVSSFQRNILKMFLWRLWMEFWQSWEYFWLIFQTFLLEILKWFKKEKFFHIFFHPTFFCISRLFLRHPDYFLSIDKKNCSNSKTEGQITLFFTKKITFSQIIYLDARIAVVTTREKSFFPTKRLLDQSPKKC